MVRDEARTLLAMIAETSVKHLPNMSSLLSVMARLRDPDSGCQWDIAQSFETIAPYTIEEAYEVADAIGRGDTLALREELGDLLLQVVFHSQMAQDQGLFEFEDVAFSISSKMIERHPHVFGDVEFESEEQQRAHWESLKAKEREQKSNVAVSAIDDVALALPSLMRAEKIQKRAARVGFDWPELAPVIDKLEEELAELREAIVDSKGGSNDEADQAAIEDELGDLLFSVTNVARHLKVDPEQALKKATAKFEGRFRHVEQSVQSKGLSMKDTPIDVLDQYWDEAKRELG